MANFNVNNFVIDRVVRGVMTSTIDGSVLWSLNQIANPSLNMTSETTDAVDALGSKIMTFERAKEAVFTAENAIFDLGLLAAQLGTNKQVASTSAKITAPKFETKDVTGTTITLSKTPKGQIKYIYALNADSTLGTKYTAGASAADNVFVHTSGATTITLPTNVTSGSVFVMYEYEADSAVQVVNKTTNFPTTGQFILEILGADVCNPAQLVYAYLIFPNAKLSGATDITFETEMAQGFEITATQNYCSKNKELFKIVIPEV